MNFEVAPASNYAMADLAELLNRGFESYFVPIQFNTLTFLNMLRKDGIDLTASRVLHVDHQPYGIALIARRGWTSRLAAMGIAKEMRGNGAGSWLMDALINEAYQREEREMVLEVIEQNETAVRVYQRSGFQIVRRLVGFFRKDAEENKADHLREMDLREMGRLVSQHGLSDLPWQLSGESIAQMNPPVRAYCKDQAYIVISDPEAANMVIWSLLVEKEARGNGLGTELLKNVIANHTNKTWHVPAIFPEEFSKVFERADFKKEKLSQWQMKLSL
jgi:ribosomal protein S18 acetylase RimI-like enzyme